jgi:hypothetical protein
VHIILRNPALVLSGNHVIIGFTEQRFAAQFVRTVDGENILLRAALILLLVKMIYPFAPPLLPNPDIRSDIRVRITEFGNNGAPRRGERIKILDE